MPKAVGEDCLGQSGNKSSDESDVFNREAWGSRNVTEPHHSPQVKSRGSSSVFNLESILLIPRSSQYLHQVS